MLRSHVAQPVPGQFDQLLKVTPSLRGILGFLPPQLGVLQKLYSALPLLGQREDRLLDGGLGICLAAATTAAEMAASFAATCFSRSVIRRA
ncbi:hypothetical protein [Streptomyces inhibens]|uniref:hypothetical protein n=1 Tax=Streptomyces inhibens TaxID=2293571 RepID=UPI001EE6D163|nr:hypothetical protein [Streptomyces inhibens]UKY53538.1 hypothetical protein KI385_35195 [Streptomyces inhibens]